MDTILAKVKDNLFKALRTSAASSVSVQHPSSAQHGLDEFQDMLNSIQDPYLAETLSGFLEHKFDEVHQQLISMLADTVGTVEAKMSELESKKSLGRAAAGRVVSTLDAIEGLKGDLAADLLEKADAAEIRFIMSV